MARQPSTMTPVHCADIVQCLKLRMSLDQREWSCTQAVNDYFGHDQTNYNWTREERSIFDALYQWRYR